MKIEFLICGSAKPEFYSQISFFRLALNSLGGCYKDARLVAVLGNQEENVIPPRWRPHFRDVDLIWAHEPGAYNPDFVPQHNKRFEVLDPTADVSIICDADVLILRPMDDLLRSIVEDPFLGGVIAHFHFPWDGREERRPERDWPELATTILGKNIDRPHRYTLQDAASPDRAPFYINFGVFAGTPEMLGRFNQRELEIRPKVAEKLGEWWAPQVSLALTCADLDLPTRALPMRYNFPNDPLADSLYPEEMENIVFLHYLRLQHFQRDRIFQTEADFQKFLNLPLTGSNLAFQNAVRHISGGVYPFAE